MVGGRNGTVCFREVDHLLPRRVETPRMRAFAESVVEFLKTPPVILGEDLRIAKANPAFWKEYGLPYRDADQPFFLEMGCGEWELPGLQAALDRVMKDSDAVEALPFERESVRQDAP